MKKKFKPLNNPAYIELMNPGERRFWLVDLDYDNSYINISDCGEAIKAGDPIYSVFDYFDPKVVRFDIVESTDCKKRIMRCAPNSLINDDFTTSELKALSDELRHHYITRSSGPFIEMRYNFYEINKQIYYVLKFLIRSNTYQHPSLQGFFVYFDRYQFRVIDNRPGKLFKDLIEFDFPSYELAFYYFLNGGSADELINLYIKLRVEFIEDQVR